MNLTSEDIKEGMKFETSIGTEYMIKSVSGKNCLIGRENDPIEHAGRWYKHLVADKMNKGTWKLISSHVNHSYEPY